MALTICVVANKILKPTSNSKSGTTSSTFLEGENCILFETMLEKLTPL